jgi:uncharacterized membrane protein YccC
MLTPPAVIRRATSRLNSRDPERDGLRRAVRATITIPLATAVSFGVGGSQTPMFTIFGSFALMVFADFPGNRQNRMVAYACLGLTGAVLITLGSALAPIPWLAVALMFCLGVAVTFVGVLSETLAAGQQATLLTFVLPVCIPTGPIGERLLGWLIALAICVPASLFLLPPRHHAELRRHAAQACATLADRLEGVGSAADVTAAMDALRANFLGTNFRPVGLTAGSRALVRVVDDLQWIADQVNHHTGAALGLMKEPALQVLRCSALVLDAAPRADRDASRSELDIALTELWSVASGRYREDTVMLLGERDDDAAITLGRELLVRRTIGATIRVTGRVIAAAAAADARPVWARVLGLRLPTTGAFDRWIADTAAAVPLTSGFLAARSVTAHNSLRTGLGLALAVAITHVLPVQHGFWVVLGVISVLRSSALTTGTKVLRAVLGTTIGVLLGAVLITLVGVDPIVLWALLPIGVFGSAYVPEVASFTAGQAAFTMALLIVFNLIQPTGWRVGLFRVEDVVVGAVAGMVVSLLLWPRGATASVNTALKAARDAGARHMKAAVLRVTRGASEAIDDHVTTLSHHALVASGTLDDAVRQYLSEKGGATDHRAPVVRAFSRASRLHAAADLIAHVTSPPPLSAYPRARKVLEVHADAICARVAGQVDSTQIPPPISDDLVPALRAESTGDDAAVDSALPLIMVAANVGELELIYPAQADAVAPVVG